MAADPLCGRRARTRCAHAASAPRRLPARSARGRSWHASAVRRTGSGTSRAFCCAPAVSPTSEPAPRQSGTITSSLSSRTLLRGLRAVWGSRAPRPDQAAPLSRCGPGVVSRRTGLPGPHDRTTVGPVRACVSGRLVLILRSAPFGLHALFPRRIRGHDEHEAACVRQRLRARRAPRRRHLLAPPRAWRMPPSRSGAPAPERSQARARCSRASVARC
jgi:hypothetical protein